MASMMIAKVLGAYFLAMGIAFFINPDRFRKIFSSIANDENFLFLGGIIALLIGAVIISFHNIWVLAWPVIITILGWWAVIKGFAFVVYPGFINYFAFIRNRSTLFYRAVSLVYIVLGLFLIYKGWWGN